MHDEVCFNQGSGGWGIGVRVCVSLGVDGVDGVDEFGKLWSYRVWGVWGVGGVFQLPITHSRLLIPDSH